MHLFTDCKIFYFIELTDYEEGSTDPVRRIELSPFSAKSVTGKTVNIVFDTYPGNTFVSSDSYCDITT